MSKRNRRKHSSQQKALGIEVGATLENLSLTVHAHPTLAEAGHEAAEHGRGHAVHILNRKPKPKADGGLDVTRLNTTLRGSA